MNTYNGIELQHISFYLLFYGKLFVDYVLDQSATSCPMPDYTRAQVGVLDNWSGGAILRVNLKPTKNTNNGWSFVLKFSR